MTRMMRYEPSDWRYHEEHTWYPGIVKGLEDDEYDHGPVVKFVTRLDGEDRDTNAIATARLTAKSKLTKWAKSLFGEDALLDGNDLDDAIGLRVEVMFEHGTNTAGEPNEKIVQMRRESSEDTAPF